MLQGSLPPWSWYGAPGKGKQSRYLPFVIIGAGAANSLQISTLTYPVTFEPSDLFEQPRRRMVFGVESDGPAQVIGGSASITGAQKGGAKEAV